MEKYFKIYLILTFLTVSVLIAPNVQAEPEFQSILDEYVSKHEFVPGVLANVQAKHKHINWSGAVGFSKKETGETLTVNHSFRIASITKIYTAAAIMRLVEKEVVKLSAPISEYISNKTSKILVNNGFIPNKIFVRHLLNHTSGIPDYAEHPAYSATILENPKQIWTRHEQLIFALTHSRAVGLPGERFSYSDTGYIILGEIIERTTHKRLGLALRHLLQFDKFNLMNTFLETTSDTPITSPLMAHAYLGSINVNQIDPSFDLFGGGGLISTIQDMTNFIRAVYRGHVFQNSTTLSSALTISPAIRNPQKELYSYMGRAIMIGPYNCWSHNGFWGTVTAHCPTPDITVSITVNFAGNDDLNLSELLNNLVLTADKIEN